MAHFYTLLSEVSCVQGRFILCQHKNRLIENAWHHDLTSKWLHPLRRRSGYPL